MARWFRRKANGRGWEPGSWEGWLVMAIFTAGIAAVGAQVRTLGLAKTLVCFALLTAMLLAVTLATAGKDSDR